MADSPDAGAMADSPDAGAMADSPDAGAMADSPDAGAMADSPDAGAMADSPDAGAMADSPGAGAMADSPGAPTITVPPAPVPVVVDVVPSRIRRPLDGARLLGLLIALAVLAGLGSVARATSSGAESDLARLVRSIPHPLLTVLSAVGGLAALGVPLGFAVWQVVQGRSRLLLEAVVTGLLAILVAAALSALITHSTSALHDALVYRDVSHASAPLDEYLAALAAFFAVSRVGVETPWRTVFGLAVGLYVLSAFTAAQASALSLVASLVLGAAVGMAVRYLAGSVNTEPQGAQLAAALDGRALTLVRLERLPATEDQRLYRATTADGRLVTLTVFDRDRIASGALYRLYRVVRVNAQLARGPVVSLERAAERRALLTMAAQSAGVPVPHLLAGVPCGADCIVLCHASVDGTALADLPQPPTRAELTDLWRNVARLHAARVTHRGLTASRLLLTPAGRIVLPVPEDGAAFATELRISVDRAQLLVTTAELTDAPTAVAIARATIGDEALSAVLPVLQPVALDRQARITLKRRPQLLESVRSEIRGQTAVPVPQLENLERVRPRTVITVVAAIVAAYLLIGQLGTVNLGTILSGLRWSWVPLILLASAATYAGAALALTGYVRERLSFARTVLAQVAASFTGFVTPPAVGGVAVNVRYLQRAGLSTTAAATSVATCQAVNALMHVVLLIGVAAVSGSTAEHRLPIPGWAFVALGIVVLLAVSLLALPPIRRWAVARLIPPIREAVPRLLGLFSDPVKLAQGLLGNLLLNSAYVAALWCATQAFGQSISVLTVAVVYLAGGAIGSLAPTPGGLGAIEAALSTGLTASGIPGATAISAVLLYRLATFWIPVPAGWAALSFLQRRHAV